MTAYSDEEIDVVGAMLEEKGLSHSEIDAFFEHAGVKGMKWGVRRKNSAGESIRELNKASRQKQREKQSSSVTRAREKVRGGQTKREFKTAKKQYKINKKELGRVEAKRILKKAKEKRTKDIYKANEYKNGKEKAAVVLAAAGLFTLAVVSGASRNL